MTMTAAVVTVTVTSAAAASGCAGGCTRQHYRHRFFTIRSSWRCTNDCVPQGRNTRSRWWLAPESWSSSPTRWLHGGRRGCPRARSEQEINRRRCPSLPSSSVSLFDRKEDRFFVPTCRQQDAARSHRQGRPSRTLPHDQPFQAILDGGEHGV